ncbi:probable sodium/metabolite cotransporter BASS2, chloroplastic [Mangifera indica]|uniref:probable sodium/metabolite cotransporter BASS2, chloroplastic n=1 Tax=Mangifera indica TaxID=29780 RepID=UPI001CFB9659|nr:probable sodium/metabolite cotransporter BASS2, chloroplastic [Mangifera indica]
MGTVIGIYKPAAVTWLETDLFTLGLGFLMLLMGLTLAFEDFRQCLWNPWTVGIGFLAQFLIKPMLGFVIAMSLKLSAPLATDLILASCCPGGQASNVATYISKGNVALSVLMTMYVPFAFIQLKSLIFSVFNYRSYSHDSTPYQASCRSACSGRCCELCIWISSRPEAFYKPELALFAWRYGFFRSQKTFTSHNPTSSGFRFDWDFFSLLPPLQLGGSALAVFWRNRPIPVDDKDEFKE